MPFKIAVIPYLDEITPEGQAIGAINIIFLRPREESASISTNGETSNSALAHPKYRYCGTSTDSIGVRESFRHNVSDSSVYRGKPGLIVGGGGTYRAALYAPESSLGCSPIYIINRDASEVESVLQEIAARGSTDHIIHVTSLEHAKSLSPPDAIVSTVLTLSPTPENEKTVHKILEHFMRAGDKGALHKCTIIRRQSPKSQS